MRVISQDGCYDIPYEQAALQRYKEKIYLMSKKFFGVEGITDNPVIAEYSTEEKAIKAMEECRWQWWKHNGFITFQFPTDEDIEV
jgi:hypothetical protein